MKSLKSTLRRYVQRSVFSLAVSVCATTVLLTGESVLGRSSQPVSGNDRPLATQASSVPASLMPTSSVQAAVFITPDTTHLSSVVPPMMVKTAQVPVNIILPIVVVAGGLLLLPHIGFLFGLVVIGEREVGVVIKKFASRNLPAGRLISLEKEAGYQADTLPPGWHWGFWPWQYAVRKDPMVIVPQGEIGLVVANDGASIPPERILGKVVSCDNFQDGRKFLTRGGEKGRQLGILTAGTYRINTALFTVITSVNAAKHGMRPENLKIYVVESERVGIITTLDGAPIDDGEIAGPIVANHDNFQNGQKFMDNGGRRGLQEQVILSGSWNLNPWFVSVDQMMMTEVPIGYVGVVISFVGRSSQDVTGESFTHGNLVNPGDKGVWVTPLYPGKHPLNTRIMKMELVPTTNIVLSFTSRISGEHGYDSKLNALKLLSFDGFTFDLEVFQIIHIGATDAPKVISRLGSMQNVVDHVLRPIVSNYFRNSAQEYTILDFLVARSERQAEAATFVQSALRAYDVQAVDTLIGLISPPPELMHTLTERKIAEEQQKTYEVQRLAQTQRQELVRETALADIQTNVVHAEQGVKIAELNANARVKQASGEAEAIRVTGQAKADAYQAGVQSLGAQSYTALQLMQVIGDRNVRVVPDVAVSGSSNGAGLVDGLLGMLLWNQASQQIPGHVGNGKGVTPPVMVTAPRTESDVEVVAPVETIATLPDLPAVDSDWDGMEATLHQSCYNVVLENVPEEQRVEAMALVGRLTDLDLRAAYDLVQATDGAPQIIKSGVSRTEAESLRQQLAVLGAEVIILETE